MNVGNSSCPGAIGVVVEELASKSRDAHLDIAALAAILNRHPKTIERAVRRGELPQPIRFLGKRVWLVGAILDHLWERQNEVIKKAATREKKLKIQAA